MSPRGGPSHSMALAGLRRREEWRSPITLRNTPGSAPKTGSMSPPNTGHMNSIALDCSYALHRGTGAVG